MRRLLLVLFVLFSIGLTAQEIKRVRGATPLEVTYLGKSPRLDKVRFDIANRGRGTIDPNVPLEVPNKLSKTGTLNVINGGPDPVIQRDGRLAPILNAPAIKNSFDGGSNLDNATVNGFRITPPDTQGDVGPNHYIQMTNSITHIYDKSGNVLLGPVPNRVFFDNLDTDLANSNDGDPIVLYDQFADRWIVSQFSISPGFADPTRDFFMLVAVSQTGDPLGEYNQYAISYGRDFPDYPKLGVWNNALYITTRDFAVASDGSSSFSGFSVVGVEKAGMYNGDAVLNAQRFEIDDPDFDGILPADADGTIPPPPGEPHYCLYMPFSFPAGNSLNLVTTTIDFITPTNSTLVITSLPVASFSYFNTGVVQPNGQVLDALQFFLMYRLQYMNFGTHASMLTTHSVQEVSGGPFGKRWYEFRNTGGGWGVHQQSTYLPADGNSRWMGSIAMNQNGDIALGYSVVGPTLNPSIRFVGQTADQSGTGIMNIPETSLLEGTMSLDSGGFTRWGDYSMMSVDPVDGDFWYTQEYARFGPDILANLGWGTNISEFSLEEPPTAICQDITVQLDATGNATITADEIDNGSVDSDGLPVASLAIDIDTFTCADVGANTVTLTVTDSDGNTAMCTATVTVEDNVAPTAVCQNITVTLDGTGNASITAGEVDGGSSDACGIASLAVSPSSFTTAEIGANTVTLTVSDVNGNSSNCTAIVTVEGAADAPNIVINEVDADTPSTDDLEFIEIYDGGVGNTSLDGVIVVLFNGGDTNDGSYNTIDLNGQSTNGDGFFVIGSATVPNVDLASFTTNGIQNGADAVALYFTDAANFPNGTAPTTTDLIDALVYDTNDADDAGLLAALGETTQYNEDENSDKDNESLSRVTDFSGAYVAQTPTPGALNIVAPPTGSITVFLSSTPSDGTDFPFTMTRPGNSDATATLDDDTDPTRSNNFTVSLLDAGDYDVSTMVPAGWMIDSIDDGGATTTPITDGVTVSLAQGQDVTLTFNVSEIPTGSITVFLSSTPSDGTDFPFTVTRPGNSDATATLDDDTDPTRSNNFTVSLLDAGDYDVSTMVPAGWMIDSIDDGGATTTPITNGVTVSLAQGEDATITFNVIESVNTPPEITTSSNISVEENQTFVVDIDANDDIDSEPLGNEVNPALPMSEILNINTLAPGGLVYSINGGPDAGEFDIDASTGVVTFMNPPDFENPSDADVNNVYLFTAVVTDSGGLSDSQDLTVTVTDVDEDELQITCGPDIVLDSEAGLCGANLNCSTGTAGSIDVLIIGIPADADWNLEVQAKLQSTGRFNTVDLLNPRVSGTFPDLATLQGYNVVLIYSDFSWNDSTSFGNTVVSYIEAGGNVVNMMFNITPPNFGLGGTFNTEDYQVIIPGGFISGQQGLGTVLNPSHPVLDGVTSFDGGSSSFRSNSNVLASGAERIANWSDGLPLVAIKSNVGSSNARRVDLNFFPPSSDSRADLWDSSTDGLTLMANSLAWAAGAGSCLTIDSDVEIASIVNDFNNTDDASDFYPLGTTTVTYTVTDVNGNTAQCSFDVTVNDTESPEAVCQNITVSLINGTATIVAEDLDGGSTDNCSDNLQFSVDQDTFTEAGVFDVVLTVTDEAGNTDTCDATVTVEGNIGDPSIDCPDDIVVENDEGVCEAVVNFDANFFAVNGGANANATDGGAFMSMDMGTGAGTVIGTPLPGEGLTGLAIGSDNTIYASSNNGNIDGTFSKLITINPNTGAVITNVTTDIVINDLAIQPGTETIFAMRADASYTLYTIDKITGVSTLVGPVASNSGGFIAIAFAPDGTLYAMPTNNSNQVLEIDPTDGSTLNTIPLGQNVGALSLAFEPISGLLYFSECCGNAGTGENIYTVDPTNGTLSFVGSAGNGRRVQDLAFGNGFLERTDGLTVVQTGGLSSGSSFPVGTTTNTFELQDGDGNVLDSCSFTVTVNDTEAPEAVCQNITVTLDETGNATIVPADVDGGSTDNCGIETYSVSPSAFTTADIGANTVILTVIDAAGYSDTCEAIVTIEAGGPIECPDYLPNEDPAIVLPTGFLTAGADEVNGTDVNTFNSPCAIEVVNFDGNEPWARYVIPIVLADYGIEPGDELFIAIDGNDGTGNARFEINQDNTPNTTLGFWNFSDSWGHYETTIVVPSGITSLDLWFHNSYPSFGDDPSAPLLNGGSFTSYFDNLFVVNLSAPGGNLSPVANAGPDQTVQGTENIFVATAGVTLDGTGSSDPDGTIVSYEWTEGGAPLASGPNPTVTLEEGVHTITLTVTDNEGGTDTDTVVITVLGEAENMAPVADAGPDQTVIATEIPLAPLGSFVTLDGTGSSDPDGTIENYEWTSPDAPTQSGATPTVLLEVGTYTFTLTVTDDDGATDTDTVVINVVEEIIPEDCPDYLPNDDFAIILPTGGLTAGADAVVGTDVNTNGSQCAVEVVNNDSGQPWSRYHIPIVLADHGINAGDRLFIGVDGNSGTGNAEFEINQNNTPNTGLGFNIFGNSWSRYETTIVVPSGITSLDMWFHSNYTLSSPGTAYFDNLVVINLDAPGGNLSPVADAGPDQTVQGVEEEEGPQGPFAANVTLDGTASFDPDGSIASYEWSEGGSQIASGSSPSIILEEGTYTITLTVTDNEGATDTDTVVITVLGEAENMPPVADAGPDQTIIATEIPLAPLGAFVTLDGTGSSDPDGTIVSYEWTSPDAPTQSGDSPTVLLEVGTYTYTLTVTDEDGATDTDTVVINVVEEIEPVACNDYLPNDDPAIVLPTGGLTAGADAVIGTDTNVNESECAIEVVNNDSGQPWSRYHIPIVLADHGISPGDRLFIGVDGNNGTGNAEFEINQNNTPNTGLGFFNFGSGWSRYETTIVVPSGITSLDLWFHCNYTLNSPGTAYFDNLEVINLDAAVAGAAPPPTELNSMVVSPNPASLTSNLSFEKPEEITEILIFDMAGRMIQRFDAEEIRRGDHYEMDVYNMPVGTYFIRSRNTEGMQFSSQMVIER